jgi:hypothetical protein
MSTKRNELEEAAERAAKGEVDPEAYKRARARMDKTREATRARIGTIEVAVKEIRAHRDE